jgi:hypothetical protein
MPCRTIHLPGGAMAIVCGPRVRQPAPRRCVVCNVPDTLASMRLCDAPREGGKPGQTCNAPVCLDHAQHIDPDIDYCPVHVQSADGCPHCGRLGNGEPCAPYCGAAPGQLT